MKSLFIMISFLILTPKVTAQQNADYLPVEHLGIEDGLSFRHVTGVYKDKEGFMWFCTTDGLNCYDGVNWVVYKHIQGDSTSIPGNIVEWIYEDINGNLIVAVKDKFKKYALFDKKKKTFRKVTFQNIDLEKEKLFLYKPFTSKSGALITYGFVYPEDEKEPSKNKFFIFNYLGNGVFERKAELRYLQETFNPNINNSSNTEKHWFKYSTSYHIIDIEAGILTRYDFIDFSGNYKLPIDKKGNFWYPNTDSKSGKLFNSFKLPTNILLEDWSHFRIDNHQNIWFIEKNRKVFRFDIRDKSITVNGEFKMDYFSITEIFEDSDGTLWMPGRFGIDKIRKKRNYFKQFAYDLDKPKTGVGNSIYSITENSDGKVHALFGINKMHTIDPAIDEDTIPSKLIAHKNGERLARLYAIEVAMLPAPNNQTWIFDFKQMFLYNPASDKIISYPLPDEIPIFKSISSGNKTANIQADESGKLWYVRNDRLYSFDTLTKTYALNSEDIFIKGIVGIGEGQKWVCSSTTLSKFDKNNQLIKKYEIPSAPIPSRNIDTYDVLPYKNKVWIATRSGLLEFDLQTEQFTRYTSEDGLPNNIIYTILPHENFLWMGTHFGLCQFNIRTKEVKNYYVQDGLTHNEFNRESALKSKNGRLYFGGLNGINAFYPEELDAASRLEPSRLICSQFSKIDGKKNTLEVYETNQLNSNGPLEIFYGDKSFTFRYALLNFLNPSDNTYSYYLDGFELDWKYADKTSHASYPTLPPGKYTFRVKAKDALGNPSVNELAIPVIVYDAWWNSWWARGLFAFLILTAFFVYTQRKTIKLRKQKKELESLVKERTIEFQEQKERAERSEKFKKQFLANMSHEIRTPMHAISGMLKILKRNKHLPSQDVFFNAMQMSSDNLVVILNDILDLSKIEEGKMEFESIPMQPAAIIENVVLILKYKAEEKGLALTYQVAENVPALVMGDPTRLNQILLNLTGNAIKFTEKGSVDISLNKVDDRLRFSIKDSGIGIPKDKLESIFGAFEQAKGSTTRNYGGTGLGLSISKRLVELQHGKIWAESKEAKGSTFYFQLPIIVAETLAKNQETISEHQLKVMAASLKGIRILLAEDNAFNQMIAQDDLSFYIEEVNIEVTENGALAVEKFKQGNYDLILMDVQMPKMNGFEATEKIRAIEKAEGLAAIPIIAMTASLLKSEIDHCHLSGMNNYIPKPYQADELIGTIFKEMNG